MPYWAYHSVLVSNQDSVMVHAKFWYTKSTHISSIVALYQSGTSIETMSLDLNYMFLFLCQNHLLVHTLFPTIRGPAYNYSFIPWLAILI